MHDVGRSVEHVALELRVFLFRGIVGHGKVRNLHDGRKSGLGGNGVGHVLHLFQPEAEPPHAGFRLHGDAERRVDVAHGPRDGFKSFPVVNEGGETLFTGKTHVLLFGSAAEQRHDVAGKSGVPHFRGFLNRACGRPAYAHVFQHGRRLPNAVPVSVRLDDGHEIMPSFQQFFDVAAEMFPVDAYMA